MDINVWELKKAIMQTGMAYQDVSEKAGISNSTLSNILARGGGGQRAIAGIINAVDGDYDKIVIREENTYIPKPRYDLDKFEKVLEDKQQSYASIGIKLGISRQAVWNMVHGVRPRMKTIKKIANALGVDPMELLKGDQI